MNNFTVQTSFFQQYTQQSSSNSTRGMHTKANPLTLPSQAAPQATLSNPNTVNVQQTQKLLEKEALSAIQSRLEAEGINLEESKKEDFSPEKVAKRILSFADSIVTGAKDDEQRNIRLQQVKQGIAEGLSQARGILDSLSVLNGEIKDNVDTTEDFLNKGMEKIAAGEDFNSIFAAPEEQNDSEDFEENTATAMTSGVSASQASAQQNTTDLEIRTKEGDIVKIRLLKEVASYQYQAGEINNKGFSYQEVNASYQHNQLQFSVEGDLNEDEQKAIGDLIKDIDKIANKFFRADVQDAFEKAQELGYDDSELSGFSLNLQSTSVQQQVSAYQTQTTPVGLPLAANVFTDTQQALQHPTAQNTFEQPQQGVGSILAGLVSNQAQNEPNQTVADVAQSLMQRVLDQVLEQSTTSDNSTENKDDKA